MAPPPLLMNWMSSRNSVRNTAALHSHVPANWPRPPSSTVREITGFSAGSDENALGSEHGAAGSAQVSSTGVGTRMPSL